MDDEPELTVDPSGVLPEDIDELEPTLLEEVIEDFNIVEEDSLSLY